MKGIFRSNGSIVMRLTGFLLFSACMLAAQEASKAPAPQTASQPVIRTGAQEVLLDLIVRDKKGKAVRDLNPNELEVYDEGTLQKVTSFRIVTANDEVGLGSGAERKQYDPMRQLRLVSVVFEGLDNESRRMTRQAALEFLKNPLEQNVYMAVFIIDQRLYVLQQFTNDRELLRRAIDTATTRQYTEFANQSAAIRKQLEQVEQNLNIAGTGSQPGRGNPGGGGFGSGMASARMAQMTLNILRYEETLTSDQQSRSSIYSLKAIIREQAGLPGRKTLVYFSGGLTVSEALIQQFRSIIGAANRANVSVYGVDARGLNSDALNTTGTSLLASAADSSRTQQLTDASINPDQVKEFDTLRDSIHSNPQQKLDELSTSTGGFMIANTNDFRPLLRRMSEDIETYYELAYAPQITAYDGRFRRVSLKVRRPNVKVQTRSGYFALPPNEESVMAYEMPLLNALNAATLPRSFQYHAAALHFGRQNDKLEYGLVVEVPMRDMTFT